LHITPFEVLGQEFENAGVAGGLARAFVIKGLVEHQINLLAIQPFLAVDRELKSDRVEGLAVVGDELARDGHFALGDHRLATLAAAKALILQDAVERERFGHGGNPDKSKGGIIAANVPIQQVAHDQRHFGCGQSNAGWMRFFPRISRSAVQPDRAFASIAGAQSLRPERGDDAGERVALTRVAERGVAAGVDAVAIRVGNDAAAAFQNDGGASAARDFLRGGNAVALDGGGVATQ